MTFLIIQEITKDLIVGRSIQFQLSTGSQDLQDANIGEIEAWGIEADLGIDFFKEILKVLTGTLNVNFF